jgi:hypothetical protein
MQMNKQLNNILEYHTELGYIKSLTSSTRHNHSLHILQYWLEPRGMLKLTRSSYLPGLSAGLHNYVADCGADGTVVAVGVVDVRGGSVLG